MAKSATFRIAPDVFRSVIAVAACSASTASVAGPPSTSASTARTGHTRPATQNDAYQKFLDGVMSDTIKPSLHGWHDAGDYGKYTTNGAFTVGDDAEAFEHFQPTLATLPLPIPEKGGAIPGFSGRGEVGARLAADHAGHATARCRSRSRAQSFEQFVMPEEDGARRYYTPISTSATADFAAALAQASRVYRPYDAALADTYLVAARSAYAFLKANGLIKPDVTMFGTGNYDANSGDRDNRAVGRGGAVGDDRRGGVPDRFRGARRRRRRCADNFDWDNVAQPRDCSRICCRRGRAATRRRSISLTASAIASANAIALRADAAAFGRGARRTTGGARTARSRACR